MVRDQKWSADGSLKKKSSERLLALFETGSKIKSKFTFTEDF